MVGHGKSSSPSKTDRASCCRSSSAAGWPALRGGSRASGCVPGGCTRPPPTADPLAAFSGRRQPSPRRSERFDMPLTEIDPKTALLVIDLQYGIVGLNTVHAASEIVQRSATLAARFREKGLPVVLVNVAGGAPGRNEMPKSSSSPAPNSTELVRNCSRLPATSSSRRSAGGPSTTRRWTAICATTA
jgi:isochorismatase family protein